MGNEPGTQAIRRAQMATTLLTAVLVAGVWPLATYSGPAVAGTPTCADVQIDASDGAGALEAAVAAANECIGAQTIEIDGGAFETDGLSITDPLAIRGVDPFSPPQIESKGSSGTVLSATTGVDVSLSDLAVETTGNWSLLNQRGGTVSLERVTVLLSATPGCNVSSGSGAVTNGGTLRLTSSSVVGASCAGISVFGGSTLELTDARVADSGSDGIDASGSTVTIQGSEIVGNARSGVRSSNPASTLSMNDTVLADNGTHGVDWASGSASISDSFVGAVPDGAGGFTAAGNVDDGIRVNFAELDLDGTLVANNGRGVYLSGGPTSQHTIDDSEIRDNTGAGVHANGGVATVADTMITGNTPNCEEVFGQIVDGGGNVVDDDSCGFASIDPPTIFVETTAGPAPFRTELRFDPGANSPESYQWTVSPSGDVFTTDEPTLDITLVDVGTHTIDVVGTLPGGVSTAEATIDLEVEPTTLSIAPIEAREGDTWEPNPGRPFDVVGLLDREVTLDVVVTPGADSSTTEAATVGPSCTNAADVALVDTEVRVGSGTVTIPIVPCRDDDPELDSVFTIELVEPTSDTVITSAEMTLLDDDRYVITPFELREGGLTGDAFESVPVSLELPINSPPWYSPAPARYTLLDVGSIPPQCSGGDFIAGADVGLSLTPPLPLSSTVVPSGVAAAPSVVVCGNATDDGTREFTIEVEAPDGSLDRGTFTVLEDDAPPQFNTTSIVIDEPTDSGAVAVEVGIEPVPYERQLAVAWAPTSGGAAPGVCVITQPFDFVPSANPLVTVPPNATSFFAPVFVCGDTPTDPDGALSLLISRPPTSVDEILTPTVLKAIPAIILDASALRITTTDVSIVEGDDGTKIAEIEILAAGNGAVSASFSTAPGGTGATAAQPGKDYVSVDGDVTAALAPWSRTVEIPVIGDVIDEDDEVFRLIVTSPDATVVDGPAQIVIVDNDVATVEVGDVSTVEGGTARVPIELSNPSERPLTVRWETRDGSATSPADYALGAGVLDFPPGATRRTVTIPVNADDLHEIDEEFSVFAAVEGPSPVSDLGEITIIDDAPPVIVGANDVLVDVPSGTKRPTSVTFDVVAEDEIDGRVPVECTPASGSPFTLGTTEVECTATDSVGGTGTATFDVVVGVFNGIVVGPAPFADLVAGIPTRPIRGGTPIRFTGPGFDPNQRVQVILRSDPVVLGTFSADADGTVDAIVTIPPGTTAGEHTLAMEAIDGDRRILVAIEVSDDVAGSTETVDPPSAGAAPVIADPVVPAGGLPSTGGNTGGTMLSGVLVTLLGAALWLLGRRRGRSSGVRHQM